MTPQIRRSIEKPIIMGTNICTLQYYQHTQLHAHKPLKCQQKESTTEKRKSTVSARDTHTERERQTEREREFQLAFLIPTEGLGWQAE